jgi:hypothetical protein
MVISFSNKQKKPAPVTGAGFRFVVDDLCQVTFESAPMRLLNAKNRVPSAAGSEKNVITSQIVLQLRELKPE